MKRKDLTKGSIGKAMGWKREGAFREKRILWGWGRGERRGQWNRGGGLLLEQKGPHQACRRVWILSYRKDNVEPWTFLRRQLQDSICSLARVVWWLTGDDREEAGRPVRRDYRAQARLFIICTEMTLCSLMRFVFFPTPNISSVVHKITFHMIDS